MLIMLCWKDSTWYLSWMTPVVSDHLPCIQYALLFNVPIHFSVKLPQISRHLPNGQSLLVVCSWYNGQCKQIPHFRWSFQPEIAGTEISVLPSDSRDSKCLRTSTPSAGYFHFQNNMLSRVEKHGHYIVWWVRVGITIFFILVLLSNFTFMLSYHIINYPHP